MPKTAKKPVKTAVTPSKKEPWDLYSDYLQLDKVLGAVNRWVLAQGVTHRDLQGMASTLSLLVLRGTTATIIDPDGQMRAVRVESLDPGMTVLVAAGARVPADGVILTGQSDIDTSLVTGETARRVAQAGDDIDRLYDEQVIDLVAALDLPCHTGLVLLSDRGSALGRVTADKRVRLVRGDREAFGKPLSHFQGVTQFLVERPKWTPTDNVAGKSLLLVGEQGLGDELMFFAALKDAERRVKNLIIECDRRMVPVLQRSFPDALVRAEQIRNARILLWKGHCSVHQMFQPSHIEAFRAKHPDGKVISHPECSFEVCAASDYIGSTEYIVKIIKEADDREQAKTIIMVTHDNAIAATAHRSVQLVQGRIQPADIETSQDTQQRRRA